MAKTAATERARPAVWIFAAASTSKDVLAPILWGLEEEGIPSELRDAPAGSVEPLAKQAADGSPLDVGIALDETQKQAVLHHRDLPAGRPLFVIERADFHEAPLRRLGVNAGRLVKREPLVLHEAPRAEAEVPNPAPLSSDAFEELVARITQHVLERL